MGRRRKGKHIQLNKILPDKNKEPQSGRSKDKTIRLHVIGPKRLLPEAKTIEAKLSSTWYMVLRQDLDLKIKPKQGIFVCSVGYTPTSPRRPRDGEGRQNGWKANLSETVKEFISKFEMSRKQYTVKLCDPSIFNTFTPRTLENLRLRRASTPGPEPEVDREGSGRETAGGRFRRALTPGPEVCREGGKGTVGGRMRRALTPGPEVGREGSGSRRLRNGVSPAPVVANNGRKRHASLNQQHSTGLGSSDPENNGKKAKESPMIASVEKVNEWLGKQEQRSLAEKFWGETGLAANNERSGCEEEEEMESLCTTASEEEKELRREGIRVEIVKPQVEARTARFSNYFMLRVKNEIQKLKRKKLWERILKRSPLACSYLQMIFEKN